MTPPLTGPELAHAFEQAEALHLQRQVDTYGRITGRAARTLSVCGGVAAFTDPAFGRKLNHVTGFAMGVAVDAAALAALEAGYAALGLGTEVDLCPHAHASAAPALGARGYVLDAFSNTYARRLDDIDVDADVNADADADAALDGAGAVEIVGARAAVERDFVAASVAGFSVQAQQRPRALLEALAQVALARADTQLFVARLDGAVAGSAGMSVLDTQAGPIAHLYIASTLPEARGRGVQSALLRARLARARRLGCVLAQVTVRTANVSARNTERAGFALAYTKATLARRPGGAPGA